MYVQPNGALKTVKRVSLGDQWKEPTDNFTAHPKLDGKTGGEGNECVGSIV